MLLHTFTWNDGVQTPYESAIWHPTRVTVEQKRRESLVPTLDLGQVRITQVKAGQADQRAPLTYTLEWEVLNDEDRDVIAMIEDTWMKGRNVTTSFYRRGAQVTLTSYSVTSFEDIELDNGLYGLRITLTKTR